MTERQFLKKYAFKFLAALCMLSLIVYTFYHAIGKSSSSLMTTPTRSITDTVILSGDACLFRDETLLTTERQGVVCELAVSGQKVGKNVPLAEVWYGPAPEEQKNVQAELDAINRMLAVLENSLDGSVTLSGIDAYRQKASELALSIRYEIQNGNWSATESLGFELLTYANRVLAVAGNRTEMELLRTQLQEQRAALLYGECQTLSNTAASGYFYGYRRVDGYEQLFTTEALKGLTVQNFESYATMEPQPSSGFAVGKMVYDYDWYLAVRIPVDASGELAVGQSYAVTFPEDGEAELWMECISLLPSEAGQASVAVLRSYEHPQNFSYLRKQGVQINLGETEGYYVPSTALYEEDGQECVYILEGNTVERRRIEIIYRGDGYVIATKQPADSTDYLRLNEMLLLSGKNLYDGKVYH